MSSTFLRGLPVTVTLRLEPGGIIYALPVEPVPKPPAPEVLAHAAYPRPARLDENEGYVDWSGQGPDRFSQTFEGDDCAGN